MKMFKPKFLLVAFNNGHFDKEFSFDYEWAALTRADQLLRSSSRYLIYEEFRLMRRDWRPWGNYRLYLNDRQIKEKIFFPIPNFDFDLIYRKIIG